MRKRRLVSKELDPLKVDYWTKMKNRKDTGIDHVIPIYNLIPQVETVSENLPMDLIKENEGLEHLSQEGKFKKTGQEKKTSNKITDITGPIFTSKYTDNTLRYQSRYQKNKGRLFRIYIL